MRYVALCMMAVVLLVIVTGCAGMMTGAAEKEIVKRAPQFLGPADRYQAHVQGLSSNKVRLVQVTGYGVRPMQGLVLDELIVTLHDVCYQRSPFCIRSIGCTNFIARVSDCAINTYLKESGRIGKGNLRDIEVKFVPNEVQVSGKVTLLGQEAPVTTTGTLQAQGTAQIYYVPQRTTIAGVEVPAATQEEFVKTINPVLDLSNLRFTLQIQQIDITPGILILSGTATGVIPPCETTATTPQPCETTAATPPPCPTCPPQAPPQCSTATGEDQQ